jgi:hypothetical protein
MSSDGNEALDKYLKQTGRTPEAPAVQPTSTPVSSTPAQIATPSHLNSPSSASNSKIRYNPRTGSPLHRKKIPGTSIEIDYDPLTGGVFLDSGELESLSNVPDIKAKLEMLLTP